MIDRTTHKAILASGTALAAMFMLAAPAFAQSLPADAPEAEDSRESIIVTGSRIKRDPADSSLPLQILTTQDLSREGISSPEQLISYLSTNGNGADNLASNSDVVSGAARGTNGLSAANLRGQGSASTLVLLNGRRVAAHGLQGSAVDVNQIPFAAIERVEVLKDGASAIYGTDAIGGVINFITKKNFTGVTLSGFVDITEAGDSPIYRLSATAGYGKLDEQGFNIMGAVSKSWNSALFGQDRDFVNGNQPNRGLSIDTRGTPIATAFPINPTAALPTGANAGNPAATVGITQGGTLLGGTTGATSLLTNPGFFIPGTTTAASGGVNPLRLTGGAGCASVDGGLNYDSVLWANPTAALACAWDTGRAATLQQPIETLTYYGRATARLGASHEIFAEITGSNAKSSKIFSNNQYSANNSTLPLAYPLNDLTRATYNDVYDRIAATLPAIGAVGDRTIDAVGNYGRPIAFRFRCIACGPRELETTTKTFRAAIGAEGPLFEGWDYRVGGSYASSTASSLLGSGYHFRGTFNGGAAATASGVAGAVSGGQDRRAPTAPGASAPGIVGLFNSGIINPFSVTQTPQALAALEAVSARGTTLYGGKYEVRQFDASIAGSLFELPGGAVQIAVGGDYRSESYKFDGSGAGSVSSPDIFNVPFDNINALNKVSRDVKAVYGEILIPIFKPLEISVAGRFDSYTTRATVTVPENTENTFNPKVSVKFRPIDWLLFRGSYNTGFRVPTFNQIFNGVTQSPNPGNTLVDPTTCPTGVVSAIAGCAAITPDSLNGGNAALGPETSKQASVGIVLQPSSRFSLSVDYWTISVDNVIGSITIPQLLANIGAFPERVLRINGIISLVDLRTGNFGSRRTQGLEFAARAGTDAFGGVISGGFDGTLLLVKREKLLPNLAYSNLRGVFSLAGDLGLKWKHSAFISYAKDGFAATFSQIYRDGYQNQALPGSPARPDFNPRVKAYVTYNTSISQRISERFMITAGVRNLFDTDPPFAITYDSNTGSGSSWEPRVADPRGRSFTLAVEVKF